MNETIENNNTLEAIRDDLVELKSGLINFTHKRISSISKTKREIEKLVNSANIMEAEKKFLKEMDKLRKIKEEMNSEHSEAESYAKTKLSKLG